MKLPKTKDDIAAAHALHGVPATALTPHIPVLLEWLQDMNWPVARPVAGALARCGLDLVEPIRAILRGDDSVWKLWVASFLCDVDASVRAALEEDILRICEHPTAEEVAEEVHLAMRDVLFVITYNDQQ